MISDTPLSSLDVPVAIVGGGPAGLMAATVLADAGIAATVFDAMPTVGRKLLLAGRGGLNLTHSEPLDRFLGRYGEHQDTFARLIGRFTPDDLRAFAAGFGVETFVGSSGRVFPVGLKASTLLRAWLRRLGGQGVSLRTRHRWQGVDGDGRLLFTTPDGPLAVRTRAAVLALGGASWPRTGSDGGWVPVLEGMGVDVAPLRPSNVGFEVPWSDHFREKNEGQPVKSIGLSFAGRMVRGEVVVTRDGIEGGAVYALSGPLRDAIEREGWAQLDIDLKPDLSDQALLERLRQRPRAAESLSTYLRKVVNLSGTSLALLHEFAAKDELKTAVGLARNLKALPMMLTGIRPIDRAISSAGGVRFDAVGDTLMLKARPGVFVAGEMLDWEAPTGGYLLQGCFALGRAAGEAAKGWLEESAA
ncbi:MAG TPA: TIGR03862 family flavoprotein [Azospirillaceae bacterium]|nr:TIGR03862 family flavoprotein [Azospirillaceae bacterium]